MPRGRSRRRRRSWLRWTGTSWSSWAASSTASRSSSTRRRGPWRAPARRSGPSAWSRSGSALSALAGIGFVVSLIWWPWQYQAPDNESGHFWYSLYTPMLGITLGLAILGLGIGVILYTKKFVPAEVAVQERHDGDGEGSAEVDRATFLAHLADAGEPQHHRPPVADQAVGDRRGRRAGPRGRGAAAGVLHQEPVEGQRRRATRCGTPAGSRTSPARRSTCAATPASRWKRREVSLVKAEDLDAGAHGDGLPVPRLREGQRRSCWPPR